MKPSAAPPQWQGRIAHAPPRRHRLSNTRPAVSEPGPRRPIMAACARTGPSLNRCGVGRGRLTTGNHTALEGSYSNSASPSSRRQRALWVSKCTRGSSSNAAACSSAGAPGAARGNAVGAMITDIKQDTCGVGVRRVWHGLARGTSNRKSDGTGTGGTHPHHNLRVAVPSEAVPVPTVPVATS